MTVYVQRDEGGKVKGVFANPQPGYAEEAVADTDPAVVAYLAGPSDVTLAPDRRARAKVQAMAKDELFILIRAVLLTILDETDTLRARIRAQDQAVAAAASLADLKTRWAALAPLPDVSVATAKQAIANKIDSGNAD
jgi:hypothetical protein